jgi:hypothetical protein
MLVPFFGSTVSIGMLLLQIISGIATRALFSFYIRVLLSSNLADANQPSGMITWRLLEKPLISI